MYIFFLLINFLSASDKIILNKNILESHIESKRKLILSAGLIASLSDRIHKTQISPSKNGTLLSVGFEIFRDKLLWDFFYTYIPKSKYSNTISTSINEFGFELKGLQAFSRYYSLFASFGLLSRQEIKDYTAYLISSGVDFNITSYFSISSSIAYKASFKTFSSDEVASSKGLSYIIKTSINI